MRVVNYNRNNYPEYRTYKCACCNYSSNVAGFKQTEYYGSTETFKCITCKILIECATEKCVDIDLQKMKLFLEPIQPICLVCNEANLEPWDIQSTQCPKCDTKMELTRLIFKPDGNNMDEIKII